MSTPAEPRRFLLPETELPTHYYHIAADLPEPLPPPLHPGTREPIGPEALAPLFPMELIRQEVSAERYIEIPEPVRDAYRTFRPSPLIRARALERSLNTPAHIYYKVEAASPAGSHKPNTALVRVSYEQKPYRRSFIQTMGATVVPSPSTETHAGRAILADDPDSSGSLGIAISEAIEEAATRDDTKYSLGSVLNHVLLHQTVIGLETKKQLEKADDEADVVIGCVGGGSNFAGLAFPFAADKLSGKKKKLRLIAVEPTACPTLTKGRYAYDFGDTVGLTPLVMMHTLGHSFVPPPVHAGGLRYHGMAPLVSKLCDEGVIEAVAVPQVPTFQAAMQFAAAEGIPPAPEAAHAIRAVMDEALRCKREGKRRTIVFNLSGHGHFDLSAYAAHMAGKLQDYEYPAEKIAEALKDLPKVKG
jgi:tryptophan synthase beta chain